MGYFSDVARRRIAAVILVVGIVLVVLAITDTAFFEDPPTESEKVEAVVLDFFDAAAQSEFNDACDLLTKGAQDVMRRAAAQALETDERLRCPEIMESVIGESFAEVAVRVRSVSVSGNRARAEASLKSEGELATFRTILLEEEEDGGGFLISDFG
jgi:cytochrome c-type biogenesis protein CcmH/NrfF